MHTMSSSNDPTWTYQVSNAIKTKKEYKNIYLNLRSSKLNISEVLLSLQKSICIPTCITLPVRSFQPLPTKEIHQGQH